MPRYNLRKRSGKVPENERDESPDFSKEKDNLPKECNELSENDPNENESENEPKKGNFNKDDDSFIDDSAISTDNPFEARPSLLDLILQNREEEMDCTINGNPKLYKAKTYRRNDMKLIKTIQSKNKGVKKFYFKKLANLRKLHVKSIVKITSILNAKVPSDVKIKLLNDFEAMCQFEYFSPMFAQLNSQIKNTLKLYEKLSEKDINPAETKTNESLMDKILSAKVSEANRLKMILKYERMNELDKDSMEYSTIRTYLLYGLKIINEPTITLDSTIPNDPESLGKFIEGVKEGLDKVMYGQPVAKDEIIATVVNRVFNIHQGNITVFEGQPGTGKTFLARNIANLLGYKFYHISLGGQASADKIFGSLSVYQSSKPGDIYNAVAEMGCNNGIILLDEFDKISAEKKELFNAFLNILDSTQNKDFKDNFLHDLQIDLSNIWFIVSVNDLSKVDPIVADRLKNIVHFKNYSIKDKREMLLNFYLPEMKAKYKLDFDLSLDESVVKLLVSSKDDDGGVRQLKSDVENLFKRIHVLHALKKSSYKPLYYVENYTDIDMITFKKLMQGDVDREKVPFGMYV